MVLFFGTLSNRCRPYYIKDPKRDPNFDNHPFKRKDTRAGRFLQGLGGGGSLGRSVPVAVSGCGPNCALRPSALGVPGSAGLCLGIFFI